MTSPARDARMAFGKELKERREHLGLTVAAVAQMTRISPPFLQAIEDGEFDLLPGQVFGRGFLRSIVKPLQLDADATAELISRFDACWAPPPAADVLKVQIKNKPYPPAMERVRGVLPAANSMKRFAAVLLALGLVLGGGALGVKVYPRLKAKVSAFRADASNQRAAPVAQAAPEVISPSKPTGAPEVKTETATFAAVSDTEPTASPSETVAAVSLKGAEGGAQVLEFVVTEPVRVRLGMDQGAPVTRELAAKTYRFSFKDQAEVLVYDAAALQISFNGTPLGALGTKGRVRRLSFRATGPEETNDKKL